MQRANPEWLLQNKHISEVEQHQVQGLAFCFCSFTVPHQMKGKYYLGTDFLFCFMLTQPACLAKRFTKAELVRLRPISVKFIEVALAPKQFPAHRPQPRVAAQPAPAVKRVTTRTTGAAAAATTAGAFAAARAVAQARRNVSRHLLRRRRRRRRRCCRGGTSAAALPQLPPLQPPLQVIAPDFSLEFAGFFPREKSWKTREISGSSREKSGK